MNKTTPSLIEALRRLFRAPAAVRAKLFAGADAAVSAKPSPWDYVEPPPWDYGRYSWSAAAHESELHRALEVVLLTAKECDLPDATLEAKKEQESPLVAETHRLTVALAVMTKERDELQAQNAALLYDVAKRGHAPVGMAKLDNVLGVKPRKNSR